MQKHHYRIALILALVWIPATSHALPGASYEEVQGGLGDKVSDLVFFWTDTPVVVSERCGTLRAVEAGTSTDLGSIGTSVVKCDQQQSGLIGLASHVLDDSQGYLYTYYTVKNSSPKQHHVVRYGVTRAAGALTINWSDETVIAQELPAFQPQHGGGGLAIGPDDTLYIGVGYDGNTNAVQDVAQKQGKILRVTLDGAVPNDNPSFAGSGAEASLFALGVNRPMHLGVDSESGQLWIADVSSSIQEINTGLGGENFGWPVYEGDKVKQPSIPLTGGEHTEPTHAYTASSSVVIGSPYRASGGEFQFPAAFSGAVPMADFQQTWFRMLRDENGQWNEVTFDGVSVQNVRAMATGPDGAIYVIEAAKQMLSRVAWTDTKPSVSIDAPSATYRYSANETLQLKGSASDGEDGELTDGYIWDITLRDSSGNPVDSESSSTQEMTYTLPDTVDINGSLTIQLTVSDSAGTTGNAVLELQPAATKVTYSTVPSEGIVVTLDGAEIDTPMEKMYPAGTVVAVSCPQEAVLGDDFELYIFDNWSDGGEPSHDFVVPEQDVELICTLRKHGPPPTAEPPVNVVVDAGTTDTGSAVQTSSDSAGGCHSSGKTEANVPVLLLLSGLLLWRFRWERFAVLFR